MTAPRPDAAPAPPATARLRGWLAASVLVQLLVLYVPRAVGPPAGLPGLDKVVHALVFLVPVLLALRLGLRPGLVLGVSAGHAVVSEVVQAALLPARSGDVWDVVADLVGVALGWWLHRRWSGRPLHRW